MAGNRATDDMVDMLHGLQCAALIAEIKRYTEHRDPETGELSPQSIPPALFAQVSKFLKDNGIDSPARAQGVRDHLNDRLPNLEDVEVEHQGYQ